MGKHIHTRIFLLVLLVILSMTIGIGLTFSASSTWYVQSVSDHDASHIISLVEESAKQLSTEDIRHLSAEQARIYSKELLQRTKEAIKTEAINGKLLIFNSKYDLVYPEAFENGEFPDELTEACSQILKRGAPDKSQEEEIHTPHGDWFLKFFVLDTDYSVRGKYFAAAVPIPDLSAFWYYTQKRFWAVLLTATAIASVLVWLISKSISAPLQHLCCQIQLSGHGHGTPISEDYSLTELQSLKNSYNQMEERIQKNEEEKKCFFQNVSHDLKTPLASITGYAQGISCGVIEDSQKAAEIILTESLRMTALVESILSLTKMDNLELQLQLIEIDLVEFTDECLEALGGIHTDASLSLNCDVSDIYIKTDPDLLKRIMQNIISNSLRYARQEITVAVTQDELSVYILIEDDGPGFDEDDLPHIFERFYKGTGGKNGIGLSFVWSAVHYLGGTIKAENRKQPDSGASYILSFPKSSAVS